MRLVLLSGGSGKRLWPLSNEARSKQFLRVLKDRNGRKVSMVQRIWDQLSKNDLVDKSIIATSLSQVEMITSQLGPDIPIVIEPQKRDTFPAIALAAIYLYSVQGCSPEEVVGILPVDSLVEDPFFQRIKDLESALVHSRAELALMGVTPTFPSSKYGYIVPKEASGEWLTVDHFKEKPDEKAAKKLIDNQALWNCGVFAFKLEYIINILTNKGFPIQYDELINHYHDLPKNSFDYEIVENAKQMVVLPYEGAWKDLGTWNTLTEEMEDNMIGKGIISNDVEHSHIINELDIPITLIGISNVIVAASPDGILVSDKDASPRVKNFVNETPRRPMYEERRWGWYRVLEHTKYKEGNEVLTKRIGIKSGKNLSYQIHFKRSEFWTITKGEGVFVLNDQLSHVRAGNVIHIPLAARHAIKATTDMEIIEVQSGSELIEEDIHRIELDWDEIEQHCKKPLTL
jgi:mannose-1-phosphate guanylyltransferase